MNCSEFPCFLSNVPWQKLWLQYQGEELLNNRMGGGETGYGERWLQSRDPNFLPRPREWQFSRQWISSILKINSCGHFWDWSCPTGCAWNQNLALPPVQKGVSPCPWVHRSHRCRTGSGADIPSSPAWLGAMHHCFYLQLGSGQTPICREGGRTDRCMCTFLWETLLCHTMNEVHYKLPPTTSTNATLVNLCPIP